MYITNKNSRILVSTRRVSVRVCSTSISLGHIGFRAPADMILPVVKRVGGMIKRRRAINISLSLRYDFEIRLRMYNILQECGWKNLAGLNRRLSNARVVYNIIIVVMTCEIPRATELPRQYSRLNYYSE